MTDPAAEALTLDRLSHMSASAAALLGWDLDRFKFVVRLPRESPHA